MFLSYVVIYVLMVRILMALMVMVKCTMRFESDVVVKVLFGTFVNCSVL